MKRPVLILVMLLCLGGCVAGMFRAAGRQRDAAQSMDCTGKLTEICCAMHRYENWHGHFPPAYITPA